MQTIRTAPDKRDAAIIANSRTQLAKLAPMHVAALADNADDGALARDKMAPLCKSLALEVRNVSRPVALAQAVLRGEPVSNCLFKNAALAGHVDALVRSSCITHIVGFSGQMAQYLPADYGRPVLMDFVDVDSAKFAAYAEQGRRQPLRWVHQREARLLGAYEAAVGRRVGEASVGGAAQPNPRLLNRPQFARFAGVGIADDECSGQVEDRRLRRLGIVEYPAALRFLFKGIEEERHHGLEDRLAGVQVDGPRFAAQPGSGLVAVEGQPILERLRVAAEFARERRGRIGDGLSLIHISEPTRPY